MEEKGTGLESFGCWQTFHVSDVLLISFRRRWVLADEVVGPKRVVSCWYLRKARWMLLQVRGE
jgi:hypothetical protein